MIYGWLAEGVEVLHLAFILFTILGQVMIFIGLALRWQWVRNPWFRWGHLACILFVAGEYVVDNFGTDIACPLTTLEQYLRTQAGEINLEDRNFVARLVDQLTFATDHFLPPLTWEEFSFILMRVYLAFAVLVLGTFILGPPRPFRRRAAPNVEPAIHA